MIWPLFRYILMAAKRDRFFLSVIGLLILTICLSVFFGSSVVTEQDRFARTFAAFGFRLFGVVALVLFTVSYIRRSFENRDIDYLLSRPISRIRFVLTHAAGFSFLAFLAALLLGGATVVLESGNIGEGVLLWWLSIAAEFIIMANVAMFFSFVVGSTTACMAASFAFYLLSRLMGEILGILQKGSDGPVMTLLAKLMELISIFIPRLDLLGQTKWILYGVPPEISIGFILAQGGVFVSLIVCATILDLHRRQF
jgi:ABC-type transport system involved in multi-copper enzyme maturation permease subunit